MSLVKQKRGQSDTSDCLESMTRRMFVQFGYTGKERQSSNAEWITLEFFQCAALINDGDILAWSLGKLSLLRITRRMELHTLTASLKVRFTLTEKACERFIALHSLHSHRCSTVASIQSCVYLIPKNSKTAEYVALYN